MSDSVRPHRRQPTRLPRPWGSQARTLEWVAISFSNEWKWKWSQSCPILSDPMDYGLPGSSVRGIFQARVLEWVAIPFSRQFSQPRAWTQVSCFVGRFLASEPPGKPKEFLWKPCWQEPSPRSIISLHLHMVNLAAPVCGILGRWSVCAMVLWGNTHHNLLLVRNLPHQICCQFRSPNVLWIKVRPI